MVKIIEDTATNAIASVVKDAIHFTGNKGESKGRTIVGETESIYLPDTQPNVASLIDLNINLIDLNTQLIDILAGGILPSNSGGNITSPTFSSDLEAKKTEIGNIKEGLKTLKDNLC